MSIWSYPGQGKTTSRYKLVFQPIRSTRPCTKPSPLWLHCSLSHCSGRFLSAGLVWRSGPSVNYSTRQEGRGAGRGGWELGSHTIKPGNPPLPPSLSPLFNGPFSNPFSLDLSCALRILSFLAALKSCCRSLDTTGSTVRLGVSSSLFLPVRSLEARKARRF
jgi:hypothetical protein